MSTKSLMDSNEVFKSEKINARNECLDGKVSDPVCVEKIVLPLATIKPIRGATVQGCTSVKLLVSRTDMYVPVDPESAFRRLETEKSSPRSAINALLEFSI